MLASRAQALAGVLGAAYPSLPAETLELFAGKLQPFDEAPGVKAVDEWIGVSKWPPAWAELRRLVLDHTAKLDAPAKRREIEAGTVPPPPEFHEARRRLKRSVERRTEELIRRPSVALGEPIVVGPHVSIVSRIGFVVWEYTLTGDQAVDRAEVQWGAEQCGLAAAEVWATVNQRRSLAPA